MIDGEIKKEIFFFTDHLFFKKKMVASAQTDMFVPRIMRSFDTLETPFETPTTIFVLAASLSD